MLSSGASLEDPVPNELANIEPIRGQAALATPSVVGVACETSHSRSTITFSTQ
jgi:hypothetical protein